MGCSSGQQCILRTNLVDWDYRTRTIEHRIQEIYGQRRKCSLETPSIPKYTRKKPVFMQHLTRHLSQKLSGEQTEKYYSPRSSKPRNLPVMVKTLVPWTRIFDRPMGPGRFHYRPTDLLLSYLSDLPQICLACLPRNKLIDIIDLLFQTRTISRLQQVPGGPKGTGFLGSALVPTWQLSTQARVQRRLNYVGPHSSSDVIGGQEAKVITCSLTRDQYYKRNSSEEQVHEALDRIPSTHKAFSCGFGTGQSRSGSQTPTALKAEREPCQPNRRTYADCRAISCFINGIIKTVDEDTTDTTITGTWNQKSSVHPHFKNHYQKPVEASSKVYAILPSTYVWTGESVFRRKTNNIRSLTQKPICLYTLPSTHRKKWALREFFQAAVSTQQYHAQIIPTSKRRGGALQTNKLPSHKLWGRLEKDKIEIATPRVRIAKHSDSSLGEFTVGKQNRNSSNVKTTRKKVNFPVQKFYNVKQQYRCCSTPATSDAVRSTPNYSICSKNLPNQSLNEIVNRGLNHTSTTKMVKLESTDLSEPRQRSQSEYRWPLSTSFPACFSPVTPPYTPMWTGQYLSHQLDVSNSSSNSDYSSCLSLCLKQPTTMETKINASRLDSSVNPLVQTNKHTVNMTLELPQRLYNANRPRQDILISCHVENIRI
ncbi:hypothetical protein EG68_03085 [Paragonimus skrjabini miyazakii]|uniref:Uncharacterized protein n=1 Tax=Paragonimus skrjabini miyazakii TaxID=59628 RepID=A0A8S9Z1A8_9TREM|nr:hypothetical protein EG68_03085 [Paragonimus skrjabini miyazakii]